MKELSIEEKAKRYDEAIERVRNHRDRDGLTLEQYETIDIIFPELKENDDEKIRKDLIEWFREFPDEIWRGHYKKDILAWLEKQGEQKSAWSEEDGAMLDNIVAWIEGKWGTIGGKVGGKEAFISFLKSLKERYTWKPSDEQINALAKNVEYVNVSCTQPILKGLLEDLKKLRKE